MVGDLSGHGVCPRPGSLLPTLSIEPEGALVEEISLALTSQF